MSAEPCPRCQGRGYVLGADSEGRARAQLCSCGTPCGRCGGSGIVRTVSTEGYAYASACTCQALPRRVALYNQSGIPAQAARRSFDNPDHDLFRAGGRNRAFEHAYRFATGYRPRARGFLLSGPPGSLKTTILCMTLSYLTLELGVECRFIEFSLLLSRIKEGFDRSGPREDLLAPVRQAAVLAVDELGKMRGTEWEMSVLDNLISHRYQAQRTTLCATNYAVAAPHGPAAEGSVIDTRSRAFAPARGETLADRVGDRIFSRLCEMCAFLDVSGPDVRRAEGPRRGGRGR